MMSAGKPDMVANCSVINKTSVSFRIKCCSGFDGGLHQEFRAEVYEVYEPATKTLIYNVSNEKAEFLISGLQSDRKYDIVLYAFNSKGRSLTTELQETLDDNRDKDAGLICYYGLPNSITAPHELLIDSFAICMCCSKIDADIGSVSVAGDSNGRGRWAYLIDLLYCDNLEVAG